MDEQKGPWHALADAAMEYMLATRHIAEWLREVNPEMETEEDEPDFSELDRLIAERQATVAALEAIDVAALPDTPANDRERMHRELLDKVFQQVAALDEENQSIMDRISRKYREKQKTVRQKREQLQTYGKQQVYGQGMQPDMVAGTYFNQAN